MKEVAIEKPTDDGDDTWALQSQFLAEIQSACKANSARAGGAVHPPLSDGQGLSAMDMMAAFAPHSKQEGATTVLSPAGPISSNGDTPNTQVSMASVAHLHECGDRDRAFDCR